MQNRLKLIGIVLVAIFFGLSRTGSSGAYLSDSETAGVTMTAGTWDDTAPTPDLSSHFSLNTLVVDPTTILDSEYSSDETNNASPEPTDTPSPTPDETATLAPATPEATPSPTDNPAADTDTVTPAPDTAI